MAGGPAVRLERFSQILSPSSGCGFAPRRPAASTMRGIACFAVLAGLVLTDEDDDNLYEKCSIDL
jgi:hypothetical protein